LRIACLATQKDLNALDAEMASTLMELDNALLTHAESSMHMACALSAIPTSIKFCTLKITDVWKFVQKDTAFKREDVNSHALRIYF